MYPIIDESKWRSLTDNLPCWVPPQTKTIIITPHPDDETLGAGGLISNLVKQKIEVKVISVTNGENAYSDYKDLAAIRIEEQNNALYRLGVAPENIIRLAFTDSKVHEHEDELENALLDIIKEPVSIFATWEHDFHPDHETVGRVAKRIAKITGSFLTYYFFWLWHRGDLQTVKDLPLQRYQLDEVSLAQKQKALAYYVSQLSPENLAPILPQNLLLPTKRSYEVYLPL